MAWAPEVNSLTGGSTGAGRRKKKWEPEVNQLTDPEYDRQYKAEQAQKVADELAKKQADQEARRKAAEDEAKRKAEEKAKQENSPINKIKGWVSDTFWDADSKHDKERRKQQGQPELYKDQRAALKQQADEFKSTSKEEFKQADQLKFSEQDVNERRDHYARAGIDIDQMLKDKSDYDRFKEENKGKSLSKLTLEGKIPENIKDYEIKRNAAIEAEKNYQAKKQTEAGADNTLQQIDRGLTRGIAEPLAKVPYSAANIAGAGLKAISEDGMAADNLAQKIADFGKRGVKKVDQNIIDTGFGAGPADNQFVSNMSQGVGSLVASMAAGPTAAATIFGINAGAEQQIAAQEKGVSDVQSFITGTVAGLTEGTLEKLGLEKFLGVKGSVVKKTLTRAVTEGTQEFLQSAGQSGIKATYDEVSFADAALQALTEGGYGALIGGGAGLPLALAENLQSQGMDPETAQQVAEAATAKMADVVNEEMPAPTEVAVDTNKQPTPEPVVEQPIPEVTPPVVEPAPPEKVPVPEAAPPATTPGRMKLGTKTATPKPVVKAAQPPKKTSKQFGKTTPKVEAPKGAPIEKPKPGRMKLGTKADVKLTYPETKDLPTEIKDKMPMDERQPKPLTTVSGRSVSVPAEASRNMAVQYAWVRSEAIKEAKFNNDKDAERDFRVLQPKTAKTEEMTPAVEYLFGKGNKPKIEYNDAVEKPTNKLTTKEVNEVNDEDMRWNSTQVKELVKNVPGLEANPVVTATKDESGDYYVTYSTKSESGTTYEGRVKLSALGISNERAAKAGIKEGTTVDLSESLKTKNKVPAVNRGGVNYDIKTESTTTKSMKREKWSGSKTPEDLAKLARDLNKAGQKNAITRRGQLKSKKAAGMFTHYPNTPKGNKNAGKEAIKLQDSVITDPAYYVTTLAHELAHAIEWQVTGYTGKKTLEMLGGKDVATKKKLREELETVADYLESKAVTEEKPGYYHSATEMWARYIELWIMEKSSAMELAPTVTAGYENLIVNEPAVQDLYNAIKGNLDKGWRSFTPSIFMDLRQTYRKALGSKVAGDAAYDAEVVRRAEVQRAEIQVKKLIKHKFKGVKDSPELLFRAAEAIRVDRSSGEMLYGTTDYRYVRETDSAYIKEKKDAGYIVVNKILDKDGNVEVVLAKVRYTPEQAKEILEQLSPEGRQLIEDFNAAKEDAKDEFNREALRDSMKITANIEGWVHRGLQKKPKGAMKLGNLSKSNLRKNKASMTKQRTSDAGNEVKDFRKQMEKAIIEAKVTDIDNAFILKQLARISKPLARGKNPDRGWVKVEYDPKYGLILPGENRETMTIQKVLLTEEEFMGLVGGGQEVISSKTFKKPRHEYQVPAALAEHYKNIRHVPQEISRLAAFLNFVGKFWAINVLTHVGTTSTNFISGGLQYGGKLFFDFYMDILPGTGLTFRQTRSNLSAPFMALTPRGWANAPGYVWGGYRSTLPGTMASISDKGMDHYGNGVLKLFSMVETYWKRVIALSEGVNMSKLEVSTQMNQLTKLEKEIIAEANKPVDLYALDYDNAPLWLERFERHGGKLAKPFIAYPYKYTKMIMEHMAAPFDRSLPYQVRLAKGMALGSIVFLINAWMDAEDDDSKVPEGTASTPYQLKPGGRIHIGVDDKGRELFVRTAKYPFFNYTALGRSLLEGKFDESTSLLQEQYGTTGIGLDLFDLARNVRSKYDTYKEPDVLFAETMSTLIPGFRMLNDIGKMIDPYSRKADSAIQAVGQTVPIWGNEDLLKKWRGDKKQLRVPVEPEEGRQINKTTTTSRDITYERADVVRSLIFGIYVTRIDPNEASQQQLREARTIAEDEINQLLAKDPDSQEARDKADQAGLIIPDGTIKRYRSLLRKAQSGQ